MCVCMYVCVCVWMDVCIVLDVASGIVPVQKGYTDVPVSSFRLPEPSEDWDSIREAPPLHHFTSLLLLVVVV